MTGVGGWKKVLSIKKKDRNPSFLVQKFPKWNFMIFKIKAGRKQEFLKFLINFNCQKVVKNSHFFSHLLYYRL